MKKLRRENAPPVKPPVVDIVDNILKKERFSNPVIDNPAIREFMQKYYHKYRESIWKYIEALSVWGGDSAIESFLDGYIDFIYLLLEECRTCNNDAKLLQDFLSKYPIFKSYLWEHNLTLLHMACELEQIKLAELLLQDNDAIELLHLVASASRWSGTTHTVLSIAATHCPQLVPLILNQSRELAHKVGKKSLTEQFINQRLRRIVRGYIEENHTVLHYLADYNMLNPHRPDFYVNAMLCDQDGRISMAVQAQQDLQHRTLTQCVDSLDLLQVLRGALIAAKLGFTFSIRGELKNVEKRVGSKIIYLLDSLQTNVYLKNQVMSILATQEVLLQRLFSNNIDLSYITLDNLFSQLYQYVANQLTPISPIVYRP